MFKHEMTCPRTNEYFGMWGREDEDPHDPSIYPLRNNQDLIFVIYELSKMISNCENIEQLCPEDCPIKRTFQAANRELWRRQEEVTDESFIMEVERLISFFSDMDRGLENLDYPE